MCAAAAAISLNPSLGEDAVQVAPGLLEEIRDRVLDGYAAAPHGGVELGFVLFGRNMAGGAVIEHFREIPCAHLLSPRFLLSPDEEKQFPEWLKKLSAESELQGAELLGWCCSHNRSEIALLDREIAFHQRYFPQPNQLLMVVKPQGMQAVAAGIFLPDERGALHGESPTVRRRSAVLDSLLASGTDSGHESGLKTANERPLKVLQPGMEVAGRSQGFRREKRFRISGWWIGVASGAAVLTAFLALVFTSGFHFPGAKVAPPALSVAIHPQANDLVFTWHSNLDQVKSANIEILDGNARSHFDITSSFQPAGLFVFPHRTGNVQVVLKVRTKRQEVVRSIGFADGQQQAADQKMAAGDRPNSAAARLDATNRRLTALVSLLESRWKPRAK